MSNEWDEFDQLCNAFDIERYDLSPSHSPPRTTDEPDDTNDDDTDTSDDCSGETVDSILRNSSARSRDDSVLEHASFDLHEYEVIEAFYGPQAKSCCKKKCNEIIPRELAYHCRDQFREFSKHEQDLIVLSHLNSHRQDISLESYYNSQTRKKYGSRNCSKTRADTIYMFQGIPICRTMYLFIYDVGIDRYKNLVSHFDKRKLQPRVHGLSNKTTKSKSGNTKELRESVVQFVKNYADHHAIPLPGRLPQFKNFRVMKLPSSHTKSSVYRRYIEACSDKKEKLIGERCFYYLWNECCPFIQTMKSADDFCDTCQENTNRISEAKSPEEREKRLKTELSHLRTARDQRAFYTQCITGNTDNAMVISFGYAQDIAYPASPQTASAAYFKTARKSSLFGVLNEKSKIQTNFLVDESCSVGQGPNAVISMLHHYLEINTADHVILLADNCVPQNKNNAMLRYLSWRVRTDLNKKISLNFLISGHTKFGPERMFGLIKIKYSMSNVDCYDDLVRCVDESSVKGLNESVRAENIDWRDWENFLKDFYCTLTGITKFHHFTFDQKDKLACKKHLDAEEEIFFLSISDVPQDATPDEIKPAGLSVDRQWYLFNEIRPLCSDPKKADKLAPTPMLPKPKKENTDALEDIENPVLPVETSATKKERHVIASCSSESKTPNETECRKRIVPTCSSQTGMIKLQVHSKKIKKN